MGIYFSADNHNIIDTPVSTNSPIDAIESETKCNLPIRTQIEFILVWWIKELQMQSFPDELISIIIDIYTYHSKLEVEPHQYHPSVNSNYDYFLRFLFIGDLDVGKTTLIKRLAYNIYSSTPDYTLSVKYYHKGIDYNDKKCNVDLCDPQGAERYKTLGMYNYRATSCIILCYDVTNKQSLESIKHWNDECNNCSKNHVLRILVGCKCDMVNNRQCTKQDISEIAKALDIDKVVEVSAKDNINTEKFVHDLAHQILHFLENRFICPFFGC
eukprot:90162_1